MLPQKLKTKIAVNLAILLLVGMVLIDFVAIVTLRKRMIQSEISKGYFFISAIESQLIDFFELKNVTLNTEFMNHLNQMMFVSGVSCVFISDQAKYRKFLTGSPFNLQDEIKDLTYQAIERREKHIRFFGTNWEGIWNQKKNLILSVPIFRKDDLLAGVGILLKLQNTYEGLKATQQILLMYICINTVILSVVGFYRLKNLIVNPMQRVIKRAEEYKDEDEWFFVSDKKENEFNKLYKALNRMLKRISDDKKKLHSTVGFLEKANRDLKKAQNDMIRAEKFATIGRLSSGMAHEIGNPIGIVLGYLELLKQEEISEKEKKEFISRAENEINRINLIIKDLLNFSRPSSGNFIEVAVHEIIKDVADVIKFQPQMTNIELVLSLLAEEQIVMANPDQLRQVFLNLILNASDAITTVDNNCNGKIIIQSKVAHGLNADYSGQLPALEIICCDNGPGISQRNLDNIFDPFFTTKEPGKGTGLGLWVCLMIVEAAGGKIRVTSREGEGARVTVYLPLYNVEKNNGNGYE